MKSFLSSTVQIMFFAIFGCFGLIIVLSFVGDQEEQPLPSFFGYQPLVVLSNSMEPFFSAGDIIISQAADAEKVQEEDVITYYDPDERIVTHRVIETTEQDGEIAFQTKGDNNNTEDEYLVAGANVLGNHSMTIPKVGYLIQFLGTPAGIWLTILLPLLIFIWITIYERISKSEKTTKEVAD
ncbi:signal peptidase I [Salsuginibacillus kocurii]|uniref:signal peptidase I n=1 Tax=Salsuginibacillus kocurii TaxID=427078 RepID=UPI0003646F79|nr:signal peptidase I [Salsuginibacillus kocurii]